MITELSDIDRLRNPVNQPGQRLIGHHSLHLWCSQFIHVRFKNLSSGKHENFISLPYTKIIQMIVIKYLLLPTKLFHNLPGDASHLAILPFRDFFYAAGLTARFSCRFHPPALSVIRVSNP